MAVTLRSSTSATGSGTTTTGTLPSGATTGDVLIAIIAQRIRSVTWTPPTGWTQAMVYSSTSGPQTTLGIFWLAAGAAEPANYTWTSSASGNSDIVIMAYSGANTTNPIDIESHTFVSATTTPIAPSITTTGAGERVISAYTTDAAATLTADAAQSLIANTTRMMVADEGFPITGTTGTRTATSNVSAKFDVATLAIAAAAVPLPWTIRGFLSDGNDGVAATTTTTSFTLPAGTQVNDTVYYGFSANISNVPTIPAGATIVEGPLIVGNNNHAYIVRYDLTATDIANGSFVGADYGAANRGSGGGIVMAGTALSQTSSGVSSKTAPSITAPNHLDVTPLIFGFGRQAATPTEISTNTSGWTIDTNALRPTTNPNISAAVGHRNTLANASESIAGPLFVETSPTNFNSLTVAVALDTPPTASITANYATNVAPGKVVQLTLSDSDTDNTVQTRTFRQISGTTVSVAGTAGNGAVLTFVAPPTVSGTTLVFGYKVNDGIKDSSEATISITIAAATERVQVSGSEVGAYRYAYYSVKVVGTVTFAATTATNTASITLPTVKNNDWLLLFAGAADASGGTPSTTNTGTLAGNLTQIGTVQSIAGHASSAWKAKLQSYDSGKTVTFVMQAATSKPVMIGLILRDVDGRDAVDNYAASISSIISSTNPAPSLLTRAINSAEINAVLTTGANPQITSWTAPSPITKQTQVGTSGPTSAASMAVGTYTLSGTSSGSVVGNRNWTADSSGTTSAWSLSIRPLGILGSGAYKVQSAKGWSTSGGTTVTAQVPFASTPKAGNYLILRAAGGVTVNTPAGYTLAVRSTDMLDAAIFYKIADGTESTSFSITMPSTSGGAWLLEEWAGVTGLDKTGSANTTTTVVAASNGTASAGTTALTSQQDELAIAMMASFAAVSPYNSGGVKAWTNDFTQDDQLMTTISGANNGYASFASKTLVRTNTVTTATSFNNDTNHTSGVIATFKLG